MREGEGERVPVAARAIRLSSMLTGLVVACVTAWLGVHIAGVSEVAEQVDLPMPFIAVIVFGIPTWAWITLGLLAAAAIVAKDRFVKSDWVAGANVGALAVTLLVHVAATQAAFLPLLSLLRGIGGKQ